MAVTSSITISLTPRSLSSKGVAAYETSEKEVKIGELFDGKGSYDVDYVAYAVRKGFENQEVYIEKSKTPKFAPMNNSINSGK